MFGLGMTLCLARLLPVMAVAGIGRTLPPATLAGPLSVAIRMPRILPRGLCRRRSAVRAPVSRGDSEADQPLDVAQERRFITRAEGDGDALGSGPRGTPD